jgi:hypothetical protein
MKLLIASLVIAPLLTITLHAQEPDPDNGGNGPPVGAPIDGGAMLLILAGALAGAKKLYTLTHDKPRKNK